MLNTELSRLFPYKIHVKLRWIKLRFLSYVHEKRYQERIQKILQEIKKPRPLDPRSYSR